MTDSNSRDDGPQASGTPPGGDRVTYGDQALHLAFQQQLAEMLARADITEEQRQKILIAATCPCCGAGGLSLSLKIRTDEPSRF